MKNSTLFSNPHRRFNPLTGEWILVSPGRTNRPWKGKVESSSIISPPTYDEKCYLCPGNERANGERNPAYDSTFVFNNDFTALRLETPMGQLDDSEILIAKSETGICRVVCFLPRHDLTLAEMSVQEIGQVIGVWTEEYKTLGRNPTINHVQIFENKGEIMGASNPHPHCQVWAQSSIPVESSKELRHLTAYASEKHSCLLCDYLKLETRVRERVVVENDGFAVVVPFWAVWPFETLIVSKRHFGSLTDMKDSEQSEFAAVIKELAVKYDNLFETSFPYSSGIHQSPTDGEPHHESHFHMHFYPPLLRSASVKKFMVGYEMMANPQRDVTAEETAERLRELPNVHFKIKSGKS